jgi:hypothetical protein
VAQVHRPAAVSQLRRYLDCISLELSPRQIEHRLWAVLEVVQIGQIGDVQIAVS